MRWLLKLRHPLLHAIREGVIAVDTAGRVTMANDGARAVLWLAADPRGRLVAGLGLPGRMVELLSGLAPAEDTVATEPLAPGPRPR